MKQRKWAKWEKHFYKLSSRRFRYGWFQCVLWNAYFRIKDYYVIFMIVEDSYLHKFKFLQMGDWVCYWKTLEKRERIFSPWMKTLLKSIFFWVEVLIVWRRRRHLCSCHGPSGLSSLYYGWFSLHGLLFFSSSQHSLSINFLTNGLEMTVELFQGLQVTFNLFFSICFLYPHDFYLLILKKSRKKIHRVQWTSSSYCIPFHSLSHHLWGRGAPWVCISVLSANR